MSSFSLKAAPSDGEVIEIDGLEFPVEETIIKTSEESS